MNRQRISKKRKSGFTLLEVMLAIVILSIGFCGITMAIGNSRKNLIRARVKRMGTELACSKMEELLHAPAAALTTGSVSNNISQSYYTFAESETISLEKRTTTGGLTYQCYLITVTVDHDLIPGVITLQTEKASS